MSFSLQLRELFIAYGLTAGAMLLGLLLMRADQRAYFRWPVYSVMVMALGVVSVEPAAQASVAGRVDPHACDASCTTARSRSTS